MSTISNSTLPNKNSTVSSSDLNTVFTETNAAFPMEADNVRNEGIDQPQWNLANASGQSDIVLLSANHYGQNHGTGVIVPANTKSVPPFDVSTTIQDEATLIVLALDDIFRVYFQLDAQITGSNTTPIAASTNGVAWAFWLEWDITDATLTNWVPVPNQSDMEDLLESPSTYGAQTDSMYATCLVSHCFVHRVGASTKVDFPPRRGHRGTFLFKSTGSYTVYGLRIRARGLFLPFYSTPASIGDPPAHNSVKLVLSPSATHQVKVYNSDISYVQMRNN